MKKTLSTPICSISYFGIPEECKGADRKPPILENVSDFTEEDFEFKDFDKDFDNIF